MVDAKTKSLRTTPQAIMSAAHYEAPELLSQGSFWELWKGEFTSPARVQVDNILFLQPGCGWKHLNQCVAAIGPETMPQTTIVVRGSSTDRGVAANLRRVRMDTGAGAVMPAGEFAANGVRSVIRSIGSAESTREDVGLGFFIEPCIHFPDQEGVEPALGRLKSWLRGEGGSGNDLSVAVLLAPAGIGKTTLMETLFFDLLRDKRNEIPLLLNREQWVALQKSDRLEVPDLWTEGFKKWYPRSLIGPEQIDTCLSLGTIRPVVDGFDELCSLFPAEFPPGETIENLIDIFDEGRLLITSRRQFWTENVPNNIRRNVYEIDLQPFTPKQRAAYLIKRYPSPHRDVQRAAAEAILDQLAGRIYANSPRHDDSRDGEPARLPMEETRFENVPFVVMLATEAADTKASRVADRYATQLAGEDPLGGLILAFCEREQHRYSLSLKPDQQLKFLETLAVEGTDRFDIEDIRVAILEAVDALSETHVERLRNHALLEQHGELYQFKYVFVQEHLNARVIYQWLKGQAETSDRVARLALGKCAADGNAIVERCVSLLLDGARDAWQEQVRRRWLGSPVVGSAEYDTRAGLVRIVLAMARRLGTTRRERLELLVGTLGDPHNRCLTGVPFVGTLQGLDLREFVFDACAFRDLVCAECLVDSSTIIRNCTFDGDLDVERCRSFGTATFVNPNCRSRTAARALQAARGGQESVTLSAEDILDAVSSVLQQFPLSAEGYRSQPVERVRHRLRHIPFAGAVLKVLERNAVLQRGTNNRQDIYGITAPADVRIYNQNAAVVGRLRTVVEELKSELIR